jgi:hypothetical protein
MRSKLAPILSANAAGIDQKPGSDEVPYFVHGQAAEIDIH